MRSCFLTLFLVASGCAHAPPFTQTTLNPPVDGQAAPGDRVKAADVPELTHVLGRTLAHGATTLQGLQVASPRLLRIHQDEAPATEAVVDLSSQLRGKTVWCQDGNSVVIDSATQVPGTSREVGRAEVVQWDYTGAAIRTFCTGDAGPPSPEAAYVAVEISKIATQYRLESLAPASPGHQPCRVDDASGFTVQIGNDGSMTASHTGWSSLRVEPKDLFCANAELWLRAHCPEEPDDKACVPDWFGLTPVY